MLILNYLKTLGGFSMAKKGQKYKKYEKELKLQVVIERINGESLSSLKEKYEITSDTRIVRWVKEYKELQWRTYSNKVKNEPVQYRTHNN